MSSFKDNPILASVTLSSSLKNIAATHEFEQRGIKTISPKGYYYLPSINDRILLSSINSPLSLGCLCRSDVKIDPGQIIITNDSGAYIKLLNNGDIEINSLTITKSGKIVNKTSNTL